MKSYEIIMYLSIIIWNIVPYFYRKHKNFYFFLFLGLNDSIGFVISRLFSISAQEFWIFFFYLMLLGLYKNYLKSKIKYYLFSLIPIAVISFTVSHQIQMIVILLFSIFFFLFFTRELISEYYLKDKLSIYYSILLFYWVISIFKLLAFLKAINPGLDIYFAAIVIQIAIGVILILMEVFDKKDLATSS